MSMLLENLISAETGFAEIQVKIRKTGFQQQKRNMEAMKYFSSEIKFSWNAVYVADTFIKKYFDVDWIDCAQSSKKNLFR